VLPLTCARCDAEIAETAKFCSACGAPVAPDAAATETDPTSEPLTASVQVGPEPEAAVRPKVEPPDGSPVANSATSGPWWKLGRPAASAAVGVGLIVLVAVVVAVAGGGDGDSSGGAADGVAEADLVAAERAGNERCAELWNSTENQTWKGLAGTQSNTGDAYVSVGFAADYPDKCLITVSIPAIRTARQFMESGGDIGAGPFGMPVDADPNSLDPSLTNWNASIDEEGTITLD